MKIRINHIIGLLITVTTISIVFSMIMLPNISNNYRSSNNTIKKNTQKKTIQHEHGQSVVAKSLSSFHYSKNSKQLNKITAIHIKPEDIQNHICSRCLHQEINDHRTTCGNILRTTMQTTRATSLAQAAAIIASQYPECQRCHPRACVDSDKRYLRYDDTAPRVLSSATIQLPSIPASMRLSKSAISNSTLYFLQNKNRDAHGEYLFDYNPSIVSLPTPVDQAYYLASFRVSNQNYCLHPKDRKRMMGEHTKTINYVGFALITANLSVLDTVVVEPKGLRSAEDFRLFRHNDQIYLSTADQIVPIWIGNASNRTDAIEMPVVYAENSHLSIWRRSFTSCAPCRKNKGVCGKNFNYFSTENHSIWVEIWPSPPRQVRKVFLNDHCTRENEPISVVSEKSPHRTFATTEEVYFPALQSQESILTRGRGGACCVEMQHPETKEKLLVGIQHFKTPSQGKKRLPAGNVTSNHYLSNLYAFRPHEPFHLLAESGFFCLGFPGTDAEEVNPIVTLTRWRNLTLGTDFDCPRIHFVSGMTAAVDDPSTVIISYGINDCFSRFIKVPMSEIQRLLFNPKGAKDS